MAAKAVRIASGNTTYLPITTSDLVQMNGTSQSLTTYINNIKETVENIEDTNSAKMTFVTQYNTQGSPITTYAYISPTGNKDTENGSVLEFRKGDNISIYSNSTHDAIVISANNNEVSQYTIGTSNIKYPFLTKNTDSLTSETSETKYTSQNTNTNTLFAYVNPSLKVSYFQYAYSTEFTENGTKLSNKYAGINHTHDVAFEFDSQQYTDDNDTVQVISYFNYPLTTSIYLNTLDSTAITYTSTSVPTKKYVDDNFVTQSVFNTAQASGMHYLGDTETLPSNPSSGDMYHTTAAISSISAEAGDFITYYKASGATSGSWSVWDKNVDKALYAGTNTLVDGRILVANGTTGNVKTQAWPALSIDTTVSSATHTFPVSIKYDAGNPNINTSISFEGDTGVTLQKKYYAGSAYISISYTPDHVGSGTAGKLLYWNNATKHSALSTSYGSNTTDAVQLHYINSGVLKNVSVGSGSNSIPTYVDSSGKIKPVTSIDSSLYTDSQYGLIVNNSQTSTTIYGSPGVSDNVLSNNIHLNLVDTDNNTVENSIYIYGDDGISVSFIRKNRVTVGDVNSIYRLKISNNLALDITDGLQFYTYSSSQINVPEFVLFDNVENEDIKYTIDYVALTTQS